MEKSKLVLAGKRFWGTFGCCQTSSSHSNYLVRKVYWKKRNKDESSDIMEESHFWIKNKNTPIKKWLATRPSNGCCIKTHLQNTWWGEQLSSCPKYTEKHNDSISTSLSIPHLFSPWWGSHWFLSFCSNGSDLYKSVIVLNRPWNVKIFLFVIEAYGKSIRQSESNIFNCSKATRWF